MGGVSGHATVGAQEDNAPLPKLMEGVGWTGGNWVVRSDSGAVRGSEAGQADKGILSGSTVIRLHGASVRRR